VKSYPKWFDEAMTNLAKDFIEKRNEIMDRNFINLLVKDGFFEKIKLG